MATNGREYTIVGKGIHVKGRQGKGHRGAQIRGRHDRPEHGPRQDPALPAPARPHHEDRRVPCGGPARGARRPHPRRRAAERLGGRVVQLPRQGARRRGPVRRRRSRGGGGHHGRHRGGGAGAHRRRVRDPPACLRHGAGADGGRAGDPRRRQRTAALCRQVGRRRRRRAGSGDHGRLRHLLREPAIRAARPQRLHRGVDVGPGDALDVFADPVGAPRRRA